MKSAKSDYELPPMPIDLAKNTAGRFITMSVMLHATILTTVALMNVPQLEFPTKEIVEFELEGDTLAVTPIADGTSVPESKGASSAAPVTLPPAPVQTKAEAPPVKAASVAVEPVSPVTTTSSVTSMPATETMATIDDISAPELEPSVGAEIPVAQMDDSELQDDFDKIDQANQKALMATKKSMQEEADQAASIGDEALKAIEKENQANAIAMAQAEEARRKSDQAAIAAQIAKEQKEQAVLERGQGRGDEGEGTGSSGSPAPTKEVAGIPGGVRSLDQLRQMPNNKFPQYAEEERLARQEGKALFYAYVNKDGSLSQFKLGQSTGYRNLDGKTLAALKKWKFYPGQEGWVEMPFKWTLNGEALQAGGKLRK